MAAQLIQHPVVEPAPGQRVLLVAVDDSPAGDLCLDFALKEHAKPTDFVQIIYVVGSHVTMQSSLTESPIEAFVVDHNRPPLITDKQKPNPANEPVADFLYQRMEPKLKEAGVTYRINVLRWSTSAVDVGKVIVANANLIRARTIVMSTGNKSGLVEAFAGSSSNYVCHNATCSVLVVRPQQ